MIFTTTDYFENEEIVSYLGIVRSFKENFDTVEEEMDALMDDLCNQAENMGADAIVGLRFVGPSTYTTQNYYGDDYESPDLIAYGTAVRLK